jgi:hypothetical protein
MLSVGQRVPDTSEAASVGAPTGKIVRGTSAFEGLVVNDNPKILFKDEEQTAADRLMTGKLRGRLDELADLVLDEWPSHKLRVTEAWDEDLEHTGNSTHYEGRAADVTVSDRDPQKLGRLASLAVEAGFDWVWYEDTKHVHVSVTK